MKFITEGLHLVYRVLSYFCMSYFFVWGFHTMKSIC